MTSRNWLVAIIWVVLAWLYGLHLGVQIGQALDPIVTQEHKCEDLFEPWREISRTERGTHEIYRCRRIK